MPRADAPPKYSLLEIERRWLVDPAQLPALDAATARRIEDRYLPGTRLRLRSIADPDGTVTMKLCKKYGRRDTIAEPITNLYLDAAEYAALASLPANLLVKRRHPFGNGSIDVHESPNAGLVMFEQQFESVEAAALFRPPVFAIRDVTLDPRYDGDRLTTAAP